MLSMLLPCSTASLILKKMLNSFCCQKILQGFRTLKHLKKLHIKVLEKKFFVNNREFLAS
jgi:hypothetical protein